MLSVSKAAQWIPNPTNWRLPDPIPLPRNFRFVYIISEYWSLQLQYFSSGLLLMILNIFPKPLLFRDAKGNCYIFWIQRIDKLPGKNRAPSPKGLQCFEKRPKVIHKLRGPNLTQFWPPNPLEWTIGAIYLLPTYPLFTWPSVFSLLTTYLLFLVHVVTEWPSIVVQKGGRSQTTLTRKGG